jgi:hypothetical protein
MSYLDLSFGHCGSIDGGMVEDQRAAQLEVAAEPFVVEAWRGHAHPANPGSRTLLAEAAWLGVKRQSDGPFATPEGDARRAERLAFELEAHDDGMSRWMLVLQRWYWELERAGIPVMHHASGADSRTLSYSLGITRVDPGAFSVGPVLPARPGIPQSFVFFVGHRHIREAAALAHALFEESSDVVFRTEQYGPNPAGLGMSLYLWTHAWPTIRQQLQALLPNDIAEPVQSRQTSRHDEVYDFLGRADLSDIPFFNTERIRNEIRIYRPRAFQELVAYLGFERSLNPDQEALMNFLCRRAPTPPTFAIDALRETGGHLVDADQLREILADVLGCDLAAAERTCRELIKRRSAPRQQINVALRERGLSVREFDDAQLWLEGAAERVTRRALLVRMAFDIVEAAYLKLNQPREFREAVENELSSRSEASS